jgi:hypothetical protein
MDPYVELLDLGSVFLKQFIESLNKSKTPGQIIDSVVATVKAIDEHKDDVVSKANLEAQRG